MAGIDTFIQVAQDGIGKMVRNFSNVINAQTVYQQVVTRAKSDGTLMENEATEATLLLVKARTDNIPPVGQALAAASTPVVLPATQITTLTPPAAITGFALDAHLTDGTAKSIARGGAKGTTTAADITSSASGANHQALDALLYDAAGNVLIGQKTMAGSIPVALASDQTVIPVNGDVDHDAVNTLKQLQIAGNAQAIDNPPTAVSASGDRVRAWMDRFGAHVVRPRQIRETYTAVFRLAEAAARLDQTFTQVANTNKQWATLHHTAAATKELKLLKVWAYITSDTTVGIQGVIELRELSVTTPPATGNPAITGRPHRIGTGAHEAVALYLPGTQGSEAAVNSPLGHVPFDTGISGAVSTVNPVPILVPVILYDVTAEDPSAIPPTAPLGVYGGWAVMIRTVGAPVLRVTIHMKFSEEIP